jgi:copper chaperone CopZ
MTRELHLEIQGMHCGACVRRVTNALQNINGVEIESVNVGSADVRLNDTVSAPDVVAAIERIGFQASPKN